MDVIVEAQLVAGVVGMVAVLRRAQPKIDGLLVALVALLVAGLAVFAYAPASPIEMLRHTLRTGMTALGSVYMVDRLGRNAPDPKGPDGGAGGPPSGSGSPYRDELLPPALTRPGAPIQRARLAFGLLAAGAAAALLVGIALSLTGCASALDVATRQANATREYGQVVHDAIEDLCAPAYDHAEDRAELERAKRVCIPARTGYLRLRAALASEVALLAVAHTGGAVDPTELARASANVVTASRAVADATRALAPGGTP